MKILANTGISIPKVILGVIVTKKPKPPVTKPKGESWKVNHRNRAPVIPDTSPEKSILRKEWERGDRIPSIRELSVSMEVNPNTVMRTYGYLQDRGIIFNKRGIGYFVAEDAYEKTLELKKQSFIKRELPHLFNTMDLLELTFEDLKTIYSEGR